MREAIGRRHRPTQPVAGSPAAARVRQIHRGDNERLMTSETGIRAERVGAIFRQMPLTAGVTVINAVLMAAVLVAVEHDNRAHVWLVAVLSISVSRLGLWWAYRRRMPEPEQSGFWGML